MARTLAQRLASLDPVADYDITHQGMLMLTHMLMKLQDATDDETEKSYWQDRIDSARREDGTMKSSWTTAQFIALQDRWIAEMDQVERYRASVSR